MTIFAFLIKQKNFHVDNLYNLATKTQVFALNTSFTYGPYMSILVVILANNHAQ